MREDGAEPPTDPMLRSRVWLGGLLGRDGGHPKAPGPLNGGPQMLQASLDGQRVYATNSLYSSWDNQFYSQLRLDSQARAPGRHNLGRCPSAPLDGTYALDPDFFVDFTQVEGGPARPHESHLLGGDCTTEIFQ